MSKDLGIEEATAAAEIVILSVPFEHTASTVKDHQGIAARRSDRGLHDRATGDCGW